MGGAAPLGLHEHLGGRQHRLHRGGDRILRRADHHRLGAAGGARRREHMGDQRTAADRMQHLGPRRPHAGTFAGGKNDGETGAHEFHPSPAAAGGITS